VVCVKRNGATCRLYTSPAISQMSVTVIKNDFNFKSDILTFKERSCYLDFAMEGRMSEHKKIAVVVDYVGKEPWSREEPGERTIGEVKIQAMEAFGLERAAADKYALQEGGVDLDDSKELEELRQNPVKMELVLKEEQHKG